MKPKTLNSKVSELLTPLIAQEYAHFYNYKASANYCRGVGFMKAAAFYETEAKEEAEHSERLQRFLTDWNVTIDLPSIKSPEVFASLPETIESAYKREYDLYEKYEEVSASVIDMDVCVFDFLRQFRDIQTSTVAEYSDKLNLLEGVEPTKLNLLLLEDKLFT
jgi:ferritin